MPNLRKDAQNLFRRSFTKLNLTNVYASEAVPNLSFSLCPLCLCVSISSQRKDPIVLRQQLVDHAAMDVGQAMIATSVAEGQFLMIDSHLTLNRCMQIVHAHRILNRICSKLIGLPISDPGLEAPAG